MMTPIQFYNTTQIPWEIFLPVLGALALLVISQIWRYKRFVHTLENLPSGTVFEYQLFAAFVFWHIAGFDDKQRWDVEVKWNKVKFRKNF